MGAHPGGIYAVGASVRGVNREQGRLGLQMSPRPRSGAQRAALVVLEERRPLQGTGGAGWSGGEGLVAGVRLRWGASFRPAPTEVTGCRWKVPQGPLP